MCPHERRTEEMIVADGLTKWFGPIAALDGVSFQVESGEIFGFLGPNGAGKTTTVRILTSILTPDSGSVHVAGIDVEEDPCRAKRLMGVVPELANAYVDLSPWQNLMIMGKIYRVRKEIREARAEEMLRRLDLLERKNDKVRGFSRGMKQKLLFAMAMISDPPLLFLDEPTSGLDVSSARLIRQMIREENERGKTVFLTTHNMDEANRLCHRIAIISRGKVVAIDTPDELSRTIEKTQYVEVKFCRAPERVDDLGRLPGVSKLEVTEGCVRLYTENPGSVVHELVRYADSAGLELLSVNTVHPTLEDVFVELTR